MTIKNVSLRHHINPLAIVAVLTVAICAATQSANANPSFPVASSVRIDLSGINLSTSGGQAEAKQRLVKAARLTCQRVEDQMDLSRHENYVACVDTAITQAMPKLAQLVSHSATVQVAANASK